MALKLSRQKQEFLLAQLHDEENLEAEIKPRASRNTRQLRPSDMSHTISWQDLVRAGDDTKEESSTTEKWKTISLRSSTEAISPVP